MLLIKLISYYYIQSVIIIKTEINLFYRFSASLSSVFIFIQWPYFSRTNVFDLQEFYPLIMLQEHFENVLKTNY